MQRLLVTVLSVAANALWSAVEHQAGYCAFQTAKPHCKVRSRAPSRAMWE